MDECLDWQGRELPRGHPYSFRGAMERVTSTTRAPGSWPYREAIGAGSGRQHRRDPGGGRTPPPSTHLRRLGAGRAHRLQPGPAPPLQPRHRRGAAGVHGPHPGEQLDTILALAQRTLRHRLPVRSAHVGDPGGQGVPVRDARCACSATPGPGSRPPCGWPCSGRATPEYPMTLLQEHPDALITATVGHGPAPDRASTPSGTWASTGMRRPRHGSETCRTPLTSPDGTAPGP